MEVSKWGNSGGGDGLGYGVLTVRCDTGGNLKLRSNDSRGIAGSRDMDEPLLDGTEQGI